MVAMHRDSPPASEAAMKYFVLGALASGLLLYGISIIYGISGTLDLQEINNYILYNSERLPMLVYGLVFIIVAIAFKLGAVPFHMWIPDVYQGAPTSVTLFISSAPKIAAFAMTIRFVNDAFMHLTPEWQGILIILSILSMAMGNIIAIAQSNIKRMLAYSTIAHIGFLLLGIISSQSVSATGIAVVFSIIGAYYYLRVVKLMYFDKPVSMTAIKATQTMRAVISLNGLAILLLGVSPGLLMTFCIEVMKL
jgi:NADH-quinone oxidoreductase subunit N